MNYIVMDLEFNQPFEFKEGKQTILVPECPFEIIQIGMVKMSKNFKMRETGNFFIKPQLYERIHPVVERITGIVDEQLSDKKDFLVVYDELLQFIGDEEAVLCVWGSNDVKLLFRNILFYKLNGNRLSRKFINVQLLANQYLQRPSGTSIGLKNAVELLKIRTDHPFHDALNDAVYTAEIFKIVSNDQVPIQIFNSDQLIEQMAGKAKQNHTLDTQSLYNKLEKSYGRRLTKKEKNLYKEVYELGRVRKFDILK